MMINFPCPKSILSMKPIEGGYFCDYCDSEVLDLTHLSDDELSRWKIENSSRCVIINESSQSTPKLTLSHFALALLLVGGASLFNFADAQMETTVKSVDLELKKPKDPSLGILHVNLVNQHGYPTYGSVWVELPNGKELEMFETEKGKFYVEIPAYCKGKELVVTAEHLDKKKYVTTAMYQVGEDLVVNITFKAKYKRIRAMGYF